MLNKNYKYTEIFRFAYSILKCLRLSCLTSMLKRRHHPKFLLTTSFSRYIRPWGPIASNVIANFIATQNSDADLTHVVLFNGRHRRLRIGVCLPRISNAMCAITAVRVERSRSTFNVAVRSCWERTSPFDRYTRQRTACRPIWHVDDRRNWSIRCLIAK